ncbi:hypothetical protein RB2654_17936 [Rhodobacterales bacterium HTCC2654]|uniref:Uncharacterized protein n=1 Tax=Maritimibacter alkaliphilus HTCC2654 TaxID=314271 RepID=A3VL56_9RHOB|nr:hypothetical protein RB2654_17936 [Rhodobacterales bacterium HTCC2654] [Maritimibacter alkaliphilus HTCC2654]
MSLRDLFLDLQRLGRQFCVLGFGKELVQTTAVVDGPQGRGRDAELDRATEGLGDQRHVVQVRQKPTLGLVVGVADIVARCGAFASQFADARHGFILIYRAVSGAFSPFSRLASQYKRAPHAQRPEFRPRALGGFSGCVK